MNQRRSAAFLLLSLAGPVYLATSGEPQSKVSFERDVRPILTGVCLQCHGASMQMSKLDMRTRAGLLIGGKNGPAIVPGNAEGSRLYRLITGKDQPRMPFGGEISSQQIATLREWIDQGAGWEGPDLAETTPPKPGSMPGVEEMPITPEARQWWAFKTPVRPRVPRPKNEEWARHPIDAFLAKTFDQKGLEPAGPADRATLVRRAYLDLIGLPPSPEEAAGFLDDTAADAWEKLIDRLLASPHYGERWGRHWLDVARYADSSGFEHDRDRPNAWRYRDYVIQSFNRDTPYNIFLAEQLAGDELDWVTFDSKIATGFLRAGPRVEFREKDNPQYRFDYLDDMIAATSQGMLGLTVQCARCHNHKFDPISQADYYRMQAVFFPTVEVNYYLVAGPEEEGFRASLRAHEERVKLLREQVADLDEPYREKAFLAEVAHKFPEDAQIAMKTPQAERTPGQQLLVLQLLRAVGVPSGALERVMPAEVKEKRKTLLEKIKQIEASRPQEPPAAMGVTDGDYRFSPDSYGDEPAPGKARRDPGFKGNFLHTGSGAYEPPPCYFLVRGEMEARGPEMRPGFPSVVSRANPPTEMPPVHGRTSGRRRALAEWVSSQENPLTARVMVNRIWHHHFGRGIVSSLNNFGKLGDRPTHPELLDWLGTEFIARGWSVKQMHRLIMTSRAYRMASAFDSPNQQIDPENNLLWKFRIQRLDAEIVRDSILAAAGNLNRQVGGPPVFPPLEASVLASMKNGIWNVEEDGPKVWRRSVYVYRKRGLPFPMFEVFDLPDQNVTCPKRYVSTVPTQALTLLNNDLVLKQAGFLAERIRKEAGSDPSARVDRAYDLTLARKPTGEEKRLALEFLDRRGRGTGLDGLAHVLLNLNEFIYLR